MTRTPLDDLKAFRSEKRNSEGPRLEQLRKPAPPQRNRNGGVILFSSSVTERTSV